MRSIYVLTTKSGTLVSKIIGLFAKGKFTHVSISFEENLQPLYSFSRKYIYFPFPGELHNEPLETGFFKKYSHIPCALYEVKVSDETYTQALSQVDGMIATAKQYKYSILGLLFCFCKMPIKRRRHYFCSEFVAEVLHRSQAIKLPKVPQLMQPNDFTDIESLECVFEGRLDELVEIKEKQKLLV